MNDKEIKKIIEDTYDESREDTILSMAKDFYSRKMLSIVIIVWIWVIIFLAGAVYTGIQFFKADQTKPQIMYAAVFVCFVHGIGLMKIFAWEMANKHSLKREIKRLELSISELAEIISKKK